MRIEKINEKQIRCTLNQKDLKDREIGISELAYGTAKAKALFQDMMQQASYELGFQADDIPLMIEAIPLLPEALILIISKVEDPDELDTRFSNFVEEKNWDEEEEYPYNDFSIYDNDSDITLYEESNETSDTDSEWECEHEDDDVQSSASASDDFISLPEILGMEPPKKDYESERDYDVVMVFSFENLESVTQLACLIHDIYKGKNTLYKASLTDTYYLVLHRSHHSTEEFRRVCNLIYEYGSIVKNSSYSQYYFEEHFTPIIREHALESLSQI